MEEQSVITGTKDDTPSITRRPQKSKRTKQAKNINKVQNGVSKTDKKITKGKKTCHCTQCGKSFTRKSSLLVHMRVHTGEKRFMCTQCGKCFSLKSSLVRHTKIHDPKPLNICPECGMGFNHYYGLLQHQKIHDEEKDYRCPVCGKTFSKISELVVHQWIHERKEQGGNGSDGPDQVTILHNKEEANVSPESERSFRKDSSLIKHQRKHKVQPLIPAVSENEHKNVSSDGDKSCTNLSDECVKTERSLQSEDDSLHTEKKVTKIKKHFLCAECGKSFTRKSSLIVHQRVHTGEKRFMCTHCGKRFGLKSSMVRHMRTPCIKSQNICSDCGRCFRRYTSLIKHQKVHRRKTKFQFSQGERSLSRASQLAAHQRIRTTSWMFLEMGLGSVERHKPTNIAEEPCIAPSYGESFREQSKFQKQQVHLKTHKTKELDVKALDEGNHYAINSTARESHERLQCGQQFGQQDLLNRHQRELTARSLSPHSMMPKEKKETTGVQCPNTIDDFKKFPEQNSSIHLTKDPRIFHSKTLPAGFERNKQNHNKRRSSSREKPYHCIECGKCFTRKSSLLVHQRIHTGEKLYMCTECGRRFSIKCSLVRHMRTHSAHALNICSQCGLYFTCYQDLSVHMESHKRDFLLNQDAVLKIKPDEQWLPDMKISSDANRTPSLNAPESGLLSGGAQRSQHHPSLLYADRTAVPAPSLNEPDSDLLLDGAHRSQHHPSLLHGATVNVCAAFSHPNTSRKILSGSLNIKKEILETERELQWLPDMQISPDTTVVTVPSLNEPDSGLLLHGAQRTQHHPPLLPGASDNVCVDYSHPSTSEKILSGSLNIKEEIIETESEQQWLPDMKISPDADTTVVTAPSLHGSDSGLHLDGAHRTPHHPSLLPGEPINVCAGYSRDSTSENILCGSLNIKEEILENTCPADELPLNHDAFLKTEPDEQQQWLPYMKCSSDANMTVVTAPSLKEPESGLHLEGAQKLPETPFMLPGAPVSACVALSHSNVWEKVQSDSLNIKEELVENICRDEPPLNRGVFLKTEPDEKQWLPHRKISPDADMTPSLNAPESGLLSDGAQRSQHHPSLLYGAPVHPCWAFSNPNMWDKIQHDSLNIKEDILDSNTCPAGEPPESHVNAEMAAYHHSINCGVDFDISKALNKDISVKMAKISVPLDKSTLEHAATGILDVSMWDHGLDENKRAQGGRKSFLCAECGKSFTRKSSLIVHQRVHTGEKRFMCTQCGKRFGLKSSMVRHMRLHSSELVSCAQ